MKWFAIQDKDDYVREGLFAAAERAAFERSAWERTYPEDAPFRVVIVVRLEDAVAACRAVRDELASAPDTGLGSAAAKLCEERVAALGKGGG